MSRRESPLAMSVWPSSMAPLRLELGADALPGSGVRIAAVQHINLYVGDRSGLLAWRRS